MTKSELIDNIKDWTLGDDIFDYNGHKIFRLINDSINNFRLFITNNSNDYYLAKEEYSLTDTREQSKDLPSDYLLPHICYYIDDSTVNLRNREFYFWNNFPSELYRQIPKTSMKNLIDRDKEGYRIDVEENEIVFYHITDTITAYFQYVKSFTKLTTATTNTTEIDIPTQLSFAENYFVLSTVDYLLSNIREFQVKKGLEQVLINSKKNLLLALNRTEPEYSENFNDWGAYY